ncbi:MAG: DUF4097 family beta strand repeat-containing protein [Clostridium sp.]|uniref:DUF4097 family beta strand repeat-containing protein n=1 Tax=Clostridium sp. TaxID=1506 RepID=UPI003F3B8AB5
MIKKMLAIIIGSFLLLTLSSCTIRQKVNKHIERIEPVNESIGLDKIEDIKLLIGGANIEVNSTKGDYIHILVDGEYNNREIKVKKDKKSVVVKENRGRKLGLLKKEIVEDKKVFIEIPEKYNGNLEIDVGSGNANINDINIDQLKVNSGAGVLNINDVNFKNIDLTQGAGKVEVDLNKMSGDINVGGGLGEFKLYAKKVEGNLNFKGGVGNADIDIPNNSPVKINTTSGIGTNEVKVSTSGEDLYKFDLEIGMGNLSIK